MALLALVCLGLYLVSARSTPASESLAQRQLATLSLGLGPAAFAEKYGGSASPRSARLKLEESWFTTLNVSWKAPSDQHVGGMILVAPPETKIPEEMLQRALAVFGGQLAQQADGSWLYSSRSSTFFISGTLGVSAGPEPGWEERLGLLWRVLRHVAFAEPFKLEESERALLNVGGT